MGTTPPESWPSAFAFSRMGLSDHFLQTGRFIDQLSGAVFRSADRAVMLAGRGFIERGTGYEQQVFMCRIHWRISNLS